MHLYTVLEFFRLKAKPILRKYTPAILTILAFLLSLIFIKIVYHIPPDVHTLEAALAIDYYSHPTSYLDFHYMPFVKNHPLHYFILFIFPYLFGISGKMSVICFSVFNLFMLLLCLYIIVAKTSKPNRKIYYYPCDVYFKTINAKICYIDKNTTQ